ncbi:MAG: tripartite tricarboxylate transporter substrate binding protein [Comamonadaceae bacterium]|nr:MAG: tripartite tricarboxylate transporter substrate binding protein [Comamonadaceae bacterium]
MTLRRRDFARAALAACAPASLCAAAADVRPGRPLRVIVVYPPGGVSSSTARRLVDPLGPVLGVPVIVEHRAGAGGSVGMDALARAAPDGQTLAFSAISPLTLHPLLARVAYDPQRIAPVASVMRTPVLVAATPAFEGRSLDELVARARAQPGAVRWATSGVATIGHMVLAQVRRQSRTLITHVPYQGGGPQLNDALSGQFEVLSTNVASLQLDYIESGRLKALAVGAPARLDALSQVPTLAELGYPSANLDSLFGLFAPPRTPPAVVLRLNAAVNQVLQDPALRLALREAHNLPAGGSADDFAREIAVDRQRNRDLVAGQRGPFD